MVLRYAGEITETQIDILDSWNMHTLFGTHHLHQITMEYAPIIWNAPFQSDNLKKWERRGKKRNDILTLDEKDKRSTDLEIIASSFVYSLIQTLSSTNCKHQ